MHSLYHARSSARKWGGEAEEYLRFHSWFDESKFHLADQRHRMLRHHSLGIQQLVERFGQFYINSIGKAVPVQYLGEQHLIEDMGFIPTFADWVRMIPRERWMAGRPGRYVTSEVTSIPNRKANDNVGK